MSRRDDAYLENHAVLTFHKSTKFCYLEAIIPKTESITPHTTIVRSTNYHRDAARTCGRFSVFLRIHLRNQRIL